eukprot:s846_g1.t1
MQPYKYMRLRTEADTKVYHHNRCLPVGSGWRPRLQRDSGEVLPGPGHAHSRPPLGTKYGEAASQGAMEALALLVALFHWRDSLASHVTVTLQSDSVVALAMAEKLTGKSPALNRLGAELAYRLEEMGLQSLRAVHVPNPPTRSHPPAAAFLTMEPVGTSVLWWPLLMIVTGYLAWLVFCLHSLRLFCGALLRGARHTLAFLRLTPRSLTSARRKPDLTEKVASASEGLAVFTEDNKNGSHGSGSSSRRRSPFNVFGTASVDNEPGKGHGKSQGTETLEQEDGYPTFGGDFVEPYGNTAVFETGGRDRKPLGSEDETVEGEQNGPGEPLTWLPFVDRFPAEHNADRESEDHHAVFAFGNSEVYVQANLAPKELTVAKGQSPGAKGARAWLESKRGTALKHDQATPTRKLQARLEAAAGEALVRLRNDFFSKSTRKLKASRMKLVLKVASKVAKTLERGRPPLPLSAEVLEGTAAVFKEAGYKSAETYLESFLFAAVWILREDELGNLCTSDVRVEDRLVFLYLANSKTDVEAEGTESTTVQVHGAVVQNPLPEEGLLPGPPPESLVPARGQGDEGGPLLVSASLGHEGSQSANSEILEGGLQDEDNGPLREKIRGLVLH